MARLSGVGQSWWNMIATALGLEDDGRFWPEADGASRSVPHTSRRRGSNRRSTSRRLDGALCPNCSWACSQAPPGAIRGTASGSPSCCSKRSPFGVTKWSHATAHRPFTPSCCSLSRPPSDLRMAWSVTWSLVAENEGRPLPANENQLRNRRSKCRQKNTSVMHRKPMVERKWLTNGAAKTTTGIHPTNTPRLR